MPDAGIHPIRVLLIDDHVVMRTGLRLVIESQPGLTIVGEATGRAEALAIAAREQPDIILLDLDLGDESGLDMLPALLASASRARVILVTGVPAPEEHLRAIHLGAIGLVRKEQAADVLVQAIEHVHAGEVWLEPAMVARVIETMSGRRNAGAARSDLEVAKTAILTAQISRGRQGEHPRDRRPPAQIRTARRRQWKRRERARSDRQLFNHHSAAGKKTKVDAPTITCGDATQVSINIQVCAGATGLPAGFTVHWVTAAALAANNNI